MKITKTLLAASIAATMTAQAEIALSDDLSLSGYFLLGGYDSDIDGDELDTYAIELETAFAWDAGNNISAVAELSFGSQNGNGEITVNYETVTLTYAATDELSFTAGNMLTYVGFETYDASGLYQSSYWGPAGPLYPAYAVGASADYVTDDFGLGLWVGNVGDKVSYEVLAQYTGIEGLTVKAIYADDPGYETMNFWASYEFGNTTLAVEYINWDFEDGSSADGFMAMAYQSFGNAGLTLRYSTGEIEDVDFDKITVCPSYSFSDSVLGLVEVSLLDIDGSDEVVELAGELLFTF